MWLLLHVQASICLSAPIIHLSQSSLIIFHFKNMVKNNDYITLQYLAEQNIHTTQSKLSNMGSLHHVKHKKCMYTGLIIIILNYWQYFSSFNSLLHTPVLCRLEAGAYPRIHWVYDASQWGTKALRKSSVSDILHKWTLCLHHMCKTEKAFSIIK